MTSYEALRGSFQGNNDDVESSNLKGGIARIDLSLWDHKAPIAIAWSILFTSSCIIPIVFYFALRYGANLALSTVLAITTAIFGVVTLFSISKRMWLLLRRKSTCRPLGASRSSLDYFQWNFLVGFCCVTAIIVAGNITKDIRVVSIGLPVLLVDVCGQLLLVAFLHARDIPAPFRISSVDKGQPIRSGVYAIAEDIVAVDGEQGQRYRRQLEARFYSSGIIRSLCFKLDVIWGVSGLACAALCFGLIFGLSDANVAYVMGWAIPWAYAVIMATVTIAMTHFAVKAENRAEVRVPRAV